MENLKNFAKFFLTKQGLIPRRGVGRASKVLAGSQWELDRGAG